MGKLKRLFRRIWTPPHRELRRPSFPTRDYEPEFKSQRQWMADEGIKHWCQRERRDAD